MKDALSVVPELFFDICGIFIPGLAFLAALYWLGYMPLLSLPDNSYKALATGLAAYMAGHMLYALSQRCIAWLANVQGKEPKSRWLESDSSPLGEHLRARLISRAAEKWCLSPECVNNKLMLYELCRNYIHARSSDRSTFLRKEQTYGELARSMVVMCLICSVLALFSSKPFIGFMVFMVGADVFYLRYLKARETDACLVFTNFLVLLEEEKHVGEIAQDRADIKAA